MFCYTLALKRRSLVPIILVLLVSFGFFNSSTTVNGRRTGQMDNVFFKVTPGDIYVYNINMTVEDWTVDVIYNEYFSDSQNDYYESNTEIIQFQFYKSDKKVSVEYVDTDVTVQGHLHFEDRIDEVRDLQWFFALKIYAIDYIGENENRTIIRYEKLDQVTILENRGTLHITKTYDLATYTLVEYTSFNNDTHESFSLSLVNAGHGMFGIHPNDTTLIAAYLLLGLFLVLLSFTLRFLPGIGPFNGIKIDNSIFETLWMKTMFFDTIEAMQKLKRSSSYYSFEFVTVLTVALTSSVIYRIINYAYNTVGLIYIATLFIPFLFVVIIKLLVWVIPAIIISYVLQYRNDNEKNLLGLKTISKGTIYMYSVYESVYLLLSWGLVLRTDKSGAGASYLPQLIHYGSLTKSIAPLFLLIANLIAEIGWFILIFWAAAAFFLTFYKISTSNDIHFYYLDNLVKEDKESIILTVILGGIWVASIFINEFVLLPMLVNLLI